ncbi:MAG: hypothetical protein WCK52_11270 [Betaproteobacteria bacterium]
MPSSSNQSSHNSANSAAFVALLCLIPIFLFVITSGWSEILAPVTEGLSPVKALNLFVKFLIAFFIALIGVALGKAIAAEQIRIKDESRADSHEKPEHRFTWVAYFLLLFSISSLGTMTFLFQSAEGQTVFSSALNKTETELNGLKTKLSTFLSTPEFSQKKARVDDLRISFEGEFKNPLNCGFGPVAIQRFTELQKELPSLRKLSGNTTPAKMSGGNNCEKIDEVIEQYRNNIETSLENSMDPQARSILTKKKELVEKIDAQIEKIEPVKNNPTSIAKAKVVPLLQESWGLYSSTVASAETLIGKEMGLPKDITDERMITVGQITNTIPMLISRWNKIDTYFIIVSAILFDILLIVFFKRHLGSSTKRKTWAF